MDIIIIIFIILIIIILLYLLYYKFLKDQNMTYVSLEETGCLYNRFGCCGDKVTPKLDEQGSNCRGF